MSARAEDVPSTSQAVRTGDALKVWSRKDKHLIDEATFIERIAQRKFVLLGEVHDNPRHHRLRERIVTKINAYRQNGAPSVAVSAAVFEHATTDRQPQLDALSTRLRMTQGATLPVTDEDAAEFFKAANWKSRGWPKSEIFFPLVRTVLGSRMPLYAGDVPRQRIMSVARGSSTPQSVALPESEIGRLALDQDLGKANNQAALSEIAVAHCGVLPESMLGPMAYAQRLRDATLADTMIEAAQKHGSAVLFAGNGHVRDDRGVPWYIRTRTGQQAVSVLFKERQTGRPEGTRVKSDRNTEDARSTSTDQRLEAERTADYVIWTPRRERPDPCLELREKYGKTKR